MKIKINKNELFANSIFFLYLYITLVANYTIYSDILTLVFLGTTAYLCLNKKRFEFSIYFFIDIIFIVYSFIQIKFGIAVYPSEALTKINTLIKCFIINLAVFNFIVIINNFKRILTVYVYAVFMGIITLFIIGWRTLLEGRFLQYTSVNFLGMEADVHSNNVGIISALALIFAVYLFIKNDKGKCFSISSVLLLCVFLTGSRKSIALAAAGLFLLIMYMYPTKKLRKIILSMMGMILGLLLLINIPFLYEIAGSRIVNSIQFFVTGETKEASMSTRNWLIEVGMEYFRKRQKTGYGLDNFRIITNYNNLYSHNNFVEILFSSGVIGFCIYYSKYILLLIKQSTLKLKKTNEYYITAKMLLCLFVIFTVFEYWFVTYYERSIIIIHIFILGFLNLYETSAKVDSKD